MTGETMLKIPNTQIADVDDLIRDMRSCPKHGLHNPFKNKERYLMYGEINRKFVECFSDKDVFEYFVKAIQRTAPKSYKQAAGEVKVTLNFYKNFCGD